MMKTLVATLDPEPRKLQQYMVFSTTNTATVTYPITWTVVTAFTTNKS